MRRVPLVGLLLAHIAGPDLCRIPDPHFVAQLLQHLHKPLRVTRRFQPNQRRHRQLPVPPLRFAVAVLQLRFSAFSALAVEPRHLLPAGMKITSYNPHRRLLPSPASFLVLYRKRRLRIGASLRPYPINPDRLLLAIGWDDDVRGAPTIRSKALSSDSSPERCASTRS